MLKRILLALAAAAFVVQVPPAGGAAAPASGRGLYMQRCEPCHAKDGSGSTAMGLSFKLRDLRSAEVQKQTDAELTEVIAKGRNGRMPAFGESLGGDKIKKVVAYLRTMKGPGKK